MNELLIFLLTILFALQWQPNHPDHPYTDENRLILDSIINISKKHSLYSDKVAWKAIESEMYSRLKGDSLTAIVEPVTYLLEQLGDFHGALYIDGKRYNSFFKTDYHYPLNMEVFNQIDSIGSEVNGLMLPERIAYLKIPHIYASGSEQISTYTSVIRNKICELKNNEPVGWVIDLRLNIGGNMYPMLAGIGELFPNLIIGGDSKDGKTFNSIWHIQNGNLYMRDTQMTNSTLLCNPKGVNVNDSKKVAFLIGRYTSSSGEAVASSFKGQKNTKLIGEITSGWSSTTGWFPINDNVLFSPTVAYFMSKDSTLHKDGVLPDMLIVEELVLDSLTTNLTIRKSIEWIHEK